MNPMTAEAHVTLHANIAEQLVKKSKPIASVPRTQSMAENPVRPSQNDEL